MKNDLEKGGLGLLFLCFFGRLSDYVLFMGLKKVYLYYKEKTKLDYLQSQKEERLWHFTIGIMTERKM